MTYDGFWTSGLGVTVDRLNAGLLQLDTIGNRPAAAVDGVSYFSTDEGVEYRDNGSSWIEVFTHGVSVIKTVDETVNNSSALQNDDDLLYAVGANELWIAEWTLIFMAGATPDIKFRVTVPTGATSRATGISNLSGASWQGQTWTGSDMGHDGSGISTPVIFTIHEYLDTGANAGNVQLQWAQIVATSEDTKVLKGSRVVARKI